MTTESDDADPNLPVHIGIIMDGNGRWATRRSQPRSQGHVAGLNAAKRIVKAAADRGIRYLTLYVFSTENWKRAAEEVGFLMGLINRYLLAEYAFYRENDVRLRHAGDVSGLPAEIASGLSKAIADTADNKGITVTLAINYGGRDEIVRAARKLIADGVDADALDEMSLSARMDNPDIPDPDLVIRTASEMRTSNFLLWEAAYAEYYFSDTLWPDWEASDLERALSDFSKRDRRYGGVKA